MRYFKVTSPNKQLPYNQKWLPIECDSSLRYEYYVYSIIPKPSFNQIWKHYFSCTSNSEKIGCTSMLYFVYYKELYMKIESVINDLQINKRDIRKLIFFQKKVLSRWMDFISKSDDSLYEQNHYFRQISKLLNAWKIDWIGHCGAISTGLIWFLISG